MTRKKDEMTVTGAVILWNQIRPDVGGVLVQYPCCGIVKRVAYTNLKRFRAEGRTTVCESCHGRAMLTGPRAVPHHNSLKTCCPRGHPYSPENTLYQMRAGKSFRRCRLCYRLRRRGGTRGTWKALKDATPVCPRCGFVPLISAQLEGHHRDGNARNNHKDNFEVVCANCHRLSTAFYDAAKRVFSRAKYVNSLS